MGRYGDIPLRNGHTTSDPRLDRIPHFDNRNLLYPVGTHPKVLKAAATPPRTRMYATYVELDQKTDGYCVGFAHTHVSASAPKPRAWLQPQPPAYNDAVALYNLAIQNDGIPHTPGEQGSTTLGGAVASVKLGHYSSFHWATSLDDIITALGYAWTPVVIGINWYDSMFQPDNTYTIDIPPTARIAGGHDTVLNGVDVEHERFRLHNSWGLGWGHNGEVWISFKNIERLVVREEGDCCVPVRKSQPKKA